MNRDTKQAPPCRGKPQLEIIVGSSLRHFLAFMRDVEDRWLYDKNSPIVVRERFIDGAYVWWPIEKRGAKGLTREGAIEAMELPRTGTRVVFKLYGFPDPDLFWQMANELKEEMERLGFIAPQPPPTEEDTGDEETGPPGRFASEMGQICGDKTEQVFISHATEDAQFAHRLADDLQQLGVQVWIGPDSIRPGESWVSAIERGLKESSHAVVVLTPAALESKWVKKETDVSIAQERKGRIQVIPLDVEPCEVPLLLSSYQMVSFRCDYDAGVSQLANILGVRVTPSEPVRATRQVPHQQ